MTAESGKPSYRDTVRGSTDSAVLFILGKIQKVKNSTLF